MQSVKQHLIERHVDLGLHRPIIDEENNIATFLLYNLSGQICGYQQYRPLASKENHNDPRTGRYYTRRTNNTTAVFGLESLKKSTDTVFIVEGIFDATRLTERGYCALAMLSNNPSLTVANFLFALGKRVVAICDADSAGKRLAKFGDVAIFTREKDLGASTETEINDIISKVL